MTSSSVSSMVTGREAEKNFIQSNWKYIIAAIEYKHVSVGNQIKVNKKSNGNENNTAIEMYIYFNKEKMWRSEIVFMRLSSKCEV